MVKQPAPLSISMTTLNNLQFLNAGYCRQLAYWTGLNSYSICKFQAVVVYFEHPVHGKFLIDTGYDDCFWPATRNFPFRAYRWLLPTSVDRGNCLTAALHHAEIAPSQLSGLFLSHFHPDHIGGLPSLPRVPLILRDQPLDHVRSLKPIQQLHFGFVPKLFDSARDSDIVSIREDQFVAQRLPFSMDTQDGLSVPDYGKDWRVFDYWNDGSLLLIDLPGHAPDTQAISSVQRRDRFFTSSMRAGT